MQLPEAEKASSQKSIRWSAALSRCARKPGHIVIALELYSVGCERGQGFGALVLGDGPNLAIRRVAQGDFA